VSADPVTAGNVAWARRIMKRAADWIAIQNIAHHTAKGEAIVIEMRNFLASTTDDVTTTQTEKTK
jgi:hypothetical protein